MGLNKPGVQHCANIEEAIAKKYSNQLNDSEEAILNRHLQDCSSCRKAVQGFERLEQEMPASAEFDLKPRPNIQAYLHQKIVRSKSPANYFWEVSTHFIVHLLKFRVPVYQAVLGMALFFALMLYAGRATLPNQQPVINKTNQIQLADTTEMMDSLNT
ncbi:hypothetical protein GWN26_03690, partial [Candidatus Saccharibacteria bacterium]|nr:hypothetical protein [Candidatus Saccharibacteria bacterium]NIV71660.1 hypothetical protein [Calditrichia bacterium]NIV98285.1 hypothetical protein [Candidatus Saccharibacteria bacterium]NIW78552.1 hypothetical protein [Calditrichia bacterium]